MPQMNGHANGHASDGLSRLAQRQGQDRDRAPDGDAGSGSQEREGVHAPHLAGAPGSPLGIRGIPAHEYRADAADWSPAPGWQRVDGGQDRGGYRPGGGGGGAPGGRSTRPGRQGRRDQQGHALTKLRMWDFGNWALASASVYFVWSVGVFVARRMLS